MPTTVLRPSWLNRSRSTPSTLSSWGRSAYAADLYIRDDSLSYCPPALLCLLLDPDDGASFLRDLASSNFPRRPILLAESRASLARSPSRHGTVFRTQVRLPDAARLQSYLSYRPLEVFYRTLEQSTQLATIPCGGFLRGHKQALYPFLNRRRLQETVATDTFFAHTRDIIGSLCAQVFYGIHSYYINVYGLRTESDGPAAFEDFLRQEDVPSILRSDNYRMQRWGTRITSIVRRHLIGTQFTEPHHPQQNPAELQPIRWLKQSVRLLRMRTGAPSTVWLYAARYMADIHNITSDETLGWSTPWSRRKRGTPDISAFLQFRFYEPVYFHNPQGKFPDTRELPGYWLGVAYNIGDTILTAQSPIPRSLLHLPGPHI
jgi:hypothetical protein